MAFAYPIPEPSKAGTREQARVMRKTKVDVTKITDRIINAVRDDNTVAPAGIIMVE